MIIDFHTHIFPDKIAERALSVLADKSGISPCTDGRAETAARFAASRGVDKSVALSIATNEKQMTNVNDFAISLIDTDFIPFGSVYPKSNSAVGEVDRIAEAGIAGIKLHPEYQQFEVSDIRCFKIVERAAHHGLIVLFHAGKDVAYPDTLNAPARSLRRLADTFPEAKLVFAHLGGYKTGKDTMDMLVGCSAYFDTACMASAFCESEAREIICAHGADKILFGSDCPWEDPAVTYSYLKRLDLPPNDMELIVCKNAQRLLNGRI